MSGMKKPKSTKLMTVKCNDCGRSYQVGAPHRMFCPARTCTECGSTYAYVLPVYVARPEALDDDGEPRRLCDTCSEELEDNDL